MSDSESPNKVKRQLGAILAVLIVLAFAAVIVAKAGSSEPAQVREPAAATRQTPTGPQQPPVPSGGPAESHADASAAYDKALASGKPIYILFHSLTCVPCVEISAVVDKVIPAYEGRAVFVNAISTDEPAMRLAEKFQFQYIPHSFFLDSKGNIVDQFEGAMDEAQMRGYLDKLTAL